MKVCRECKYVDIGAAGGHWDKCRHPKYRKFDVVTGETDYLDVYCDKERKGPSLFGILACGKKGYRFVQKDKDNG